MKLNNENISILFRLHYLRSEDKSEYIDKLYFERTAKELVFLVKFFMTMNTNILD